MPKGDWIYEIKFDGYRALALRGGSETQILSRNQKDLGGKFPEVRDSIAALNIQDAIIDGEIMAFDENWSPVKTGTGFFISPDGLAVTNFHVIQGASHLSGRTNEGAVFKFERVVAHPSGVDLAILKFAAEGVACLKLGHSTDAVEGQTVPHCFLSGSESVAA
jgi:S1-C subfamily serine protease